MASLKEIKERIGSVRSTRKITSAMKMVAASKLCRSQAAVTAMAPYSAAIDNMARNLLSGADTPLIPLATEREVQTVVLMPFSSNGSLCGSFNETVFDRLKDEAAHYADLPNERIRICAVGRHVAEQAESAGMNLTQDLHEIVEHPAYESIAHVAQKLIDDFTEGRIDRVDMIYHRFVSVGSQTLVTERLLPIELSAEKINNPTEYILEPSREELIAELIPHQIKLKLFTVALSSVVSEHAARMIAMQAATDNADELISDLNVEFNKLRQSAITNELLDIMGGQNR